MPEVKAKKNGKSKSKSPKKLLSNNKKKLPPSRRNEIWETMSDDLSETPSSPTDVMDIGDEELSRCYSEELKDDDDEVHNNIVDHHHETTNSPSWRSVNNRIDMSGSIHSSEEFDPLNDDDDDDMDSAYFEEECGLPAAPFSSDISQKKTSEMSLKELKAELLAYNLSPEDFLEKNEMIKAVREARKRHSKNTKTTPEDHTQRSQSVSISNEASSTRFEKQDKVIYKSSDGTKEVATILKIHLDDELVPFYDIRLVDSGKEKQTDDAHLSPISTNRQLSGQIPDSIAFSFDDDNEGEIGEYELGVSVQSQSYYDIEDAGDDHNNDNDDNDDDEYEEISHHSRTPLQNRRSLTASHRSAGTPTGHSGRARRSIETSGRNRNSVASAPAGMKRNSVQSSPHQNTKARGRNSDFHGSSSRRGSANMSPTRPPHLRHMSPTRPPARRSSTNNTSSPTRPPSCRRRDSTDSNCYARPSSTRSSNNTSPTRPSSSIRIGRRDSNENNNHRPSSIRTSHTSPTRPPPPIRSNGRPQSVRSTSPPPPRNNNATRHSSSAPLSPTKSPIKNNNNSKTKNLSPKRPTTTRKTDLSPKRPKASTTSPGNSNQPAPYGHSLKLLKKRMSS